MDDRSIRNRSVLKKNATKGRYQRGNGRNKKRAVSPKPKRRAKYRHNNSGSVAKLDVCMHCYPSVSFKISRRRTLRTELKSYRNIYMK